MNFYLYLSICTTILINFTPINEASTQTIEEPFSDAVPVAQESTYEKELAKQKISYAAFKANFDPQKSLAVRVVAADLATLLQTNSSLNVLDARTKKAYEVSRIKNAKWVGFKDFSFKRVWMLEWNKAVVVYSMEGKKSLLL